MFFTIIYIHGVRSQEVSHCLYIHMWISKTAKVQQLLNIYTRTTVINGE